jgi:hypothetical protein
MWTIMQQVLTSVNQGHSIALITRTIAVEEVIAVPSHHSNKIRTFVALRTYSTNVFGDTHAA